MPKGQNQAIELQTMGEEVQSEPELVEQDSVIANTDPIFVLYQIEEYDEWFREYAGSSSPEYQKLEEAYRAAKAFDADDELEEPGTGDRVRQELHKAAAAYYNAKLSQEQNELRSNRMELARKLFHETAPERSRGEEWRDVEADIESIDEQPEYQPLTVELSAEDRKNAYLEMMDELNREATSLYIKDGKVLLGKGIMMMQLALESAKIKEKVNAGETDGSLLEEIKNYAKRARDMDARETKADSKMTAQEKQFIERIEQLKAPEETADDELRGYTKREERQERRKTVESYRDKLQKMQETLKNTERRFFNNDSREYNTMVTEVGNMLEFLNGSMLGQNSSGSIIDLDSAAFKFRLNKLQGAAAGYSNAKIMQDKNANRQTRFDIAGELMELPDLNQHRKDLAPKEAGLVFSVTDTLIALDNAELQTAEDAAAFVNDADIKKVFEADNFEDRLNDFDEVNIAAVRSAKQVYDLLKKEQEGRELLSDPAPHSAAELAMARRNVLLGVGIRDYITENAASFTQPEENSPIYNYFSSLGEKPEQLDKVKDSLLQNAKSVAALEKKVRAETPDFRDFRASARALVVDEPEAEEEAPEIEEYKPIEEQMEVEPPEVEEEIKTKSVEQKLAPIEAAKPAELQTPEEQEILGKLNDLGDKFVLAAKETDPLRKAALLAMVTKLVAAKDQDNKEHQVRDVSSRPDFLANYVNAKWLVDTVNGMSTDEIAALSKQTPQELNAWSEKSIAAAAKNLPQEEAAQAEAQPKKTVNAALYLGALSGAVLGYHGSLQAVQTLQETVSGTLKAHDMLLDPKKVTELSMTPEELQTTLQASVEESRKVLDRWGTADNIKTRAFENDAEMALDVQLISHMAQKGIDPNGPEGSRLLLASKIAMGGGLSFTDSQDFLCHPDKFLGTVELISRSPSFRSFTKGKSDEEIRRMAQGSKRDLYEDFLNEMEVTRQKKQGVPEVEAREAVKAAKPPEQQPLTVVEQIQKDTGVPMEQAEAIADDLKKALVKGASLDEAQKIVSKKYPEYAKSMEAKSTQQAANQKLTEEMKVKAFSVDTGIPMEHAQKLYQETQALVKNGKDPQKAVKTVISQHPEVKEFIEKKTKQQTQEIKQQQVKDAYKKKQNLTPEQPLKKPVASK